MFTSSPQSVEVHQAGTWWTGELLGWRHDASGTCQMWVRVVVGGVEETAWIDLAALRLPDPEVTPSAAPGRIDSRVKQVLPPAQAISALRGRPVAGDGAATAVLPIIRDEVSASAPAVASRAQTGTPAVAVRRTGRRRAPEKWAVQELPVPEAPVQEAAAQEAPVQVDAAGVSVSAGRHRAPDDEGRHRAADTEVFAPVSDVTDEFPVVPAESVEPRRAARPHSGAAWAVPTARAARPEESYGRSEVCTGRIDAEPDLLTRPMRLSDLSTHPRRPRVGGSLTGV